MTQSTFGDVFLESPYLKLNFRLKVDLLASNYRALDEITVFYPSPAACTLSDSGEQVKVVVSDEDDNEDNLEIMQGPLAKKKKTEPVKKSIQSYAQRLFRGYR